MRSSFRTLNLIYVFNVAYGLSKFLNSRTLKKLDFLVNNVGIAQVGV